MNEESLPEELIYDILRSCIVASPETFLDPANSRAFFRRPDAPPSPIGSSHLLLVSKRWRRIGTPLLYTSLWLSKAFHTLTVADLFQSYPSLAERVIDLRLEGGFVPQILDLIRLAPNIRNVYLSWHLDKLDDTTSLHKALRCLQPKTLYLGHQREDVGLRQQSAALSTLVDSLVSEGWQSLEYVHLAYGYQLTPSTSRALQTSPSLENVCVHSEDLETWSWSTDLLDFIDSPFIRAVLSRSTLSADFTKFGMIKHGVSRRIVDRLTFVEHPIEYGEFDEPPSEV